MRFLPSKVALAGGVCLLLNHSPAQEPPLPQPLDIPGNWDWEPAALPPIQEIVARPQNPRPVYGLHCWENEYRKYHDFIRNVGWSNFRLSSPITDEVLKLYAQDEAEVMFTMAARRPFATEEHPLGEWRNRANFETDESFIQSYLDDVGRVLERYGPEGSFWKENPNLPTRPLKLIEIYNEPNFWYLDTARDGPHFPPKDPALRKAQDRSRQELYAKLLAAGYAHIKKCWPDVQVVGFAAGGAAGADVPFIKGWGFRSCISCQSSIPTMQIQEC